MAKIFLRIIRLWNLVRRPFIIILSVIILSFFGVYLFSQTRIVGDAASHLILAVSPILKIGSPYKDFWDIKPPVLPFVLYLWSNVFGFGIVSIRIFGILIAILVLFTNYLIYKKVFQTPVLEIVYMFTVIIVLSPLLHSIMLPTEFLGLLLSLGALLSLIGFRKVFYRFYFSGLLFFVASQTKEPFAFTILAVLPVLFESLLKGGFIKFLKNSVQFLLGILTGVIGIYVYLAGLGSVDAYFQVFKYKQIFYPFKLDVLSQNFLPGLRAAERTFTEFSYGFSILIVLAAISFYFVNKFKKTLNFNQHNSSLVMKPLTILTSELAIKYSVFFYALGSFLGFGLGYTFGSHYLIQVVVPFYIMVGLIVSYLFGNVIFSFGKSKIKFFMVLVLLVFSLIVIMPKRQYLSSYLPKSINTVILDQITGFERRVEELTTKDQCVLSVYGWGVSENYLYSKRKSCTRFFLPNIVKEDWQKKEYLKAIIENPPATITYQMSGADLDIQKFELEVINIGKIIKNCYIQDTVDKSVYIPKMRDFEGLKKCVKFNST